jgi:hypothetical protein
LSSLVADAAILIMDDPPPRPCGQASNADFALQSPSWRPSFGDRGHLIISKLQRAWRSRTRRGRLAAGHILGDKCLVFVLHAIRRDFAPRGPEQSLVSQRSDVLLAGAHGKAALTLSRCRKAE